MMMMKAIKFCKCDACGWQGDESQLRCEFGDIEDLYERLDPDGIVPVGECPECGSLAYVEPSQWQPVASDTLTAAAPELLAACEYVVKWHRDNDSGEGEKFGLDFVTTCIAAIAKAKGQ